MKALRLTVLGLVFLACFLVMGIEVALAQEPVASAVPGSVPYIDNQAHPVQPLGSALYKFDYQLSVSSKQQMTTITLLYGNKSGVGFEVWSADAVINVGDNDPFGRGMPGMTPCDTGWCATDDLVWVGAPGATGTYFVRIVNYNPWATSFRLTISGKGVNLAPIPIVVTGPSAVAAPIVRTMPVKYMALKDRQLEHVDVAPVVIAPAVPTSFERYMNLKNAQLARCD